MSSFFFYLLSGWSWLKRAPLGYSFIIFGTALGFFLIHPFGNVFQIVGDNICQIAYWHVLFNPHLTGSIGASVPKPGLILLLGLTYDLSVWLGLPVLIKILLAFFAALVVYAVARLAADLAGGIAAVVSALFLISMTPLTQLFVGGSSMVFFLPVLLLGLRFFAHGRPRLGTIMLCFAMLIRPEVLGVLLWLMVSHQLIKRRFKKFIFSLLCVLFTLFILFITSYLVQGNISRLNAGGPSTGYIFPHASTFTMRFGQAIEYVAHSTWTIATQTPSLMFLSVPAFLTLLLFCYRKIYMSIIGIVIFWIVYFSFGSGDFVDRYFEFLIPFIVALGWGGIFYTYHFILHRASQSLWIRNFNVVFILFLLYASLFMINATIVSFKEWQTNFALGGGYAVYTWDVMQLLETNPIPKGNRVLTEDDIVYGIVARDPNYFRTLSALQVFNIKNDAYRHKILASTNYILISKAPYQYYYLRYDPLHKRNNDLFRRTIGQLIKDGKRKSIYNRHLTPVINSASWIVLRVDP